MLEKTKKILRVQKLTIGLFTETLDNITPITAEATEKFLEIENLYNEAIDELSKFENIKCPEDLRQWVSDEKMDWILYDVDLLPEQIDSKEKVCALRGFKLGWEMRVKNGL
jgi:hypothetical protein